MEPVIRDYRTFDKPSSARAFLESASHHFVRADTYLPEDTPAPLLRRVIVLGENRKAGYQHLPLESGDALIMSVCRLILAEISDDSDLDLAQFLQGFLGQIKDHEDLSAVARNITMKVSELFEAEGAAILVYDESRNVLRFASSYTQGEDLEPKLKDIELELGQGIAGWVAANKKPLLVNCADKDPRFEAGVDQQTAFRTRDLMAAPILLGNKLIGVLEVVNRKRNPFYEYDLPTLCVLSSVVSIFLEKAQLLAQRKKYLQVVGKAEIANSVLHNIGNVLNSQMTSCRTMQEHLEQPRMKKLDATCKLILENVDNLASWLTEDPRGKMVPPFLQELARQLILQQGTMVNEVEKIMSKTQLMKEIIETQQTIARSSSLEAQDLIGTIEEALAIVEELLEEQSVQVVRDFHSDKPVRGQKTKLVHIMINLFKNAAEAMRHLPKDRRILRLETQECETGGVCLSVMDQGSGISEEARAKMFSHGFTTKENGHGFGLNFCAKAMEEMDGSISVHSEGVNMGATFTLRFPDYNKANFLEG